MWLTAQEEQILEGIRSNKPLNKKEQDAIATYGGFCEARDLNPNTNSPGPSLYNELQDILRKYANNTGSAQAPVTP